MPRLPLVALLLASLSASPLLAADGPARPPVRLFSVLPPDFRHPESLAVDPADGTLYVGSFDAREPAAARDNQLLRLAPDGRVLASHRFGPTPLTGLAFAAGHVYVLNFGLAALQRLPADFDARTPVETVARFAALPSPSPGERRVDNPDGSHDLIRFGASGMPGPNGIVFARDGSAYVSDSFQGAIYRIADAATCTPPCRVELLVQHPLLATAGALPFGANGLALDATEEQLYVNNAGDGRLLRMPVGGGTPTIVAESLHGADGLLFDRGLFWVCANQADAVVAVDAAGRERVRAGHFAGLRADGSPDGLLFPAASVVSGRRMIVANLALPLTAATGDEWEEDVVRWNLVQFDLPDATGR